MKNDSYLTFKSEEFNTEDNREMSGKNHNRKRNAGLIYEQLVKKISSSLIDGDNRKSGQALKLLKKHFKPGTELYKEFRLINSLLKSTVSSEVVAGSILAEAKVAVKSYDLAKLDREKSLLIRNINHCLNEDGLFYDQHVSEYKMYATIQTLVNDWRSSGHADLARLAEYEDKLVKWLMTEKVAPQEVQVEQDSPGTSRLLLKMMTKKLNEKYAGSLTNDQKKLIREFAFFVRKGSDNSSLKEHLVEVKTSLLGAIDKFVKEESDSKYTNEKLLTIRSEVESELFESVDDEMITKFLLYSKLRDELTSSDADSEGSK